MKYDDYIKEKNMDKFVEGIISGLEKTAANASASSTPPVGYLHGFKEGLLNPVLARSEYQKALNVQNKVMGGRTRRGLLPGKAQKTPPRFEAEKATRGVIRATPGLHGARVRTALPFAAAGLGAYGAYRLLKSKKREKDEE